MALAIGTHARRLLVAAALLILAGCDSESAQDLPPRDPVPRQGSLRVVNMIPDAPAVTALLSGFALGALDYGQATPLSKQIVGLYSLRLAHVDPDGEVTEVAKVDNVELTQEKELSFLLLGTWAQPVLTRIDNVEIDFGIDPKKDNPSNEADVQVVHGATATGAVDVYLTNFGASLTGVTPLARVSFGQVDALETVTPGTAYQLRVTPSGATTPVLFDSGSFEINGFTRQLFVVRDYQGPGTHPLRVTRVTETGALTFPNEALEVSVRFANYVADAPSVDVFFGETTTAPVFTGVGLPTQSAYAATTPGTRSVRVTAAGTTSPLVIDGTTTLGSGGFYTIFAGGRDQGDTAGIATVFDDIRPIATEARLRIDHAANAAGAIDIYVLDPGQSVDGASPAFTSVTLNSRRVVSLLPGTHDITVTPAGSKVVLAGPEPVQVELGGLYTLALTESPGGGGPLVLQRQDDLAP